MSNLQSKELGKRFEINNLEKFFSRREFGLGLASLVLTFIFDFLNPKQIQAQNIGGFSEQNIDKITTLIRIYKQNGKLNKIEIIRSKRDQKLIISFLGERNPLIIQNKYEKFENEKFNRLKRELEADLFLEMKNIDDFETILDGVPISFENLR